MYWNVGVGPHVIVQSSSISHDGQIRPPDDELDPPPLLLPVVPASPVFVVEVPASGRGGEWIFALGSAPLHAAASAKEESNPRSIRGRRAMIVARTVPGAWPPVSPGTRAKRV
jgi:hypothetical protein